MKLYVLDLGRIVMMADNPVTKDEGENPSIPIHAFLIETDEQLILFDTGCVPDCMDGAWPKEMCANPYIPSEDGTLPEALERIDVLPEDINYVVASHLHLDHGGAIHLFPNATVLVEKNELEKVLEDEKNGTLGMFHMQCDVDNWKNAGVKWQKVEEKEVTLSEGIKVLNLGSGHSYGMLAMLLEMNDRNFLLVSDTVYSAVHYGPPAELAGVVLDEKGYFEAIEVVRDYAEKYDATVLYGHDMAQFKLLMTSDYGYYE